jgi:hypothetical protein
LPSNCIIFEKRREQWTEKGLILHHSKFLSDHVIAELETKMLYAVQEARLPIPESSIFSSGDITGIGIHP